MQFHFVSTAPGEVEVSYRSSKEEVRLGTLTFVDCDGDQRPELARLLATALRAAESPMLVVTPAPW